MCSAAHAAFAMQPKLHGAAFLTLNHGEHKCKEQDLPAAQPTRAHSAVQTLPAPVQAYCAADSEASLADIASSLDVYRCC